MKPNYPQGRILVFARTPELGAVKTRLQPQLGLEACYQLHQALVEQVVQTATGAGVAPVEIWHTGNPEHEFWQGIKARTQISIRQQSDGNLGDRMHHASHFHLSNHSEADPVGWAIIIGSDCIDIDQPYLLRAAEMLESGSEVVIGPAEDGGYVLVGMRRPLKFLFEGVDWGTSKVLEQTLSDAVDKNCHVELLEARRDLDNFDDYQHFKDRLTWNNSASSRQIHQKA